MAKVRVDFTVSPGQGVQAYWIAVGKDDVPLAHGKGAINLETGVPTVLVWWFQGNPGSKLAIVGKEDNRTVVEVKESKVPPGRTGVAGFRPFIP